MYQGNDALQAVFLFEGEAVLHTMACVDNHNHIKSILKCPTRSCNCYRPVCTPRARTTVNTVLQTTSPHAHSRWPASSSPTQRPSCNGSVVAAPVWWVSARPSGVDHPLQYGNARRRRSPYALAPSLARRTGWSKQEMAGHRALHMQAVDTAAIVL